MHEATPAFEEVFETYAGFAWRVLARLGVPQRELEDVCQEVFLVVHQRLASFEGRSSVKSWLYGICRRVAANHRRRGSQAREVPSAAPEPEPTSEAQDALLQAVDQRRSVALLERLLRQLPEAQYEVFVLYELEELSMREVAEALGCSPNTAFSRLYAARRALRRALKRWQAQRRVA